MKKKKTLLRWKDGRLDADSLGSAGLRFVVPWLRSRLEGHDSFIPIDHRVDEDPEAFIVGLLREVGTQHDAFKAIASSVLELLDEARDGAPKLPVYFQRLIRLCQLTALPQVQSWFSEEVADVAAGRPPLWPEGPARHDILYAAVIQKAGSDANWNQLLSQSAFATLALIALGPTFRDRVKHLSKWWSAVERDEGDRELNQVLRAALREYDESEVREILRSEHKRFPSDLQASIDARLRSFGRSEVFTTRPIRSVRVNPMVNAGWRREYLHAG